MKRYDFIFAGGGLAGSSLAYTLAHSTLRDARMLIVDRDPKNRNDRTFCFWANRPTLFDDIVQREWSQIHFAGKAFESEIDLGEYSYKLIRGIDLYHHTRKELSKLANVEFLQGRVWRIEDSVEGAAVWIDGEAFEAEWVFDSRFDHSTFRPDPARHHSLWQYFQGWEIETAGDAFDPQAVTLLDFRTPQENAMSFFYVLPFSRRRALVEYVTTKKGAHTAALKAYIGDVLQVSDYRILATEGGVNPMSDVPFPRRAGEHTLNIGTRGGRIKPSTGYAFLRIQQDCANIVESLITRGHPFALPPDSRRYRLYDALMLEIMTHRADEIKPIFTALFKNNPVARVLRFLDEEGTLGENAQLIASLPPQLFLQAMVRTGIQNFNLSMSLRALFAKQSPATTAEDNIGDCAPPRVAKPPPEPQGGRPRNDTLLDSTRRFA